MRLLDLEAALAARGYGADGALVVEVADPLRPRNQGRFRLEAGQAGASCARTSADAMLACDSVPWSTTIEVSIAKP